MTRHIDASLAKGIRRAYLESLDSSLQRFSQQRRKELQRNPSLQVETSKGFDKEVEKLRRNINASGMIQSEISVSTKHKRFWASLFLTRETEQSSGNGRGMSPTGHARTTVLALTFPPARNWMRPMSIKITAHAIDRVIQRMGIVDAPISPEDIKAVNAEVAQSLIWAAASFFILGRVPPAEAEALTLIFPSQHGFFIGKYLTSPVELSLVTYVDRNMSWEEQREAFRILDAASDSELGFWASDVIARHHIIAEHSDADDLIYHCWRDYGWRIREKLDRPGQLDAAWNSKSP
jgi:hypothetical protein